MARLKFLAGSEIQFRYGRIKSTFPDMIQFWYNHFYTSTCIYDDLG